MNKKQIGPTLSTFPMPVVLVGTVVDDKVNFMAASWCTIACKKPETIAVAINKVRHTLKGIQKEKTFSINVPIVDQIKLVDFCGIYSGKNEDKSELFEVFYGDIKTAPLIKECPLNLECKVIDTVDIGTHDLVVAHIVQSHADDSILTEGRVDLTKMNPLIYYPPTNYYAMGEHVADAFSVGKKS